MRNLSILTLVLAALMIFAGCEDNDSSSDNSTLSNKSTIKYMNDNRSEIELDNGYTLSLVNVSISRQRESCSGFDSATAAEIEMSDIVEYTYVNNDMVDYVAHYIIPATIKLERKACKDADEDGVQYVLDSDEDGVADANDADPNDPNVQ